MSELKHYIGLIVGGSAFSIGKRHFPDFTKVLASPASRRGTADELFGSLYDALVNCDEEYIDVVAYRADLCNPVNFRIDDADEHEDDLVDLKMQLVDGKVDVIVIKPKNCIETIYSIVPVDGDMQ